MTQAGACGKLVGITFIDGVIETGLPAGERGIPEGVATGFDGIADMDLPLIGTAIALLTLIGSMFEWIRRQLRTTIKEHKDLAVWRTRVDTNLQTNSKRLENHSEKIKTIADWRIAAEKDIEGHGDRLDQIRELPDRMTRLESKIESQN